MKIHHVGYLVGDIEKSKVIFERLGYCLEGDKGYDNNRDIYIQFMRNEQFLLELVEPASVDSPLFSAMKRFKNLPYHICYETSDINTTIGKLGQEGFRLSRQVEPAVCIGNRNVAFMQSPEIGIIELLEKEE